MTVPDNNSLILMKRRFCGIPLPVWAGFILSAGLLYFLFMFFTVSVGHEARLKYEFITFAGDALLVMAPFWLLTRRWRLLAVIPVAVIALFLTGCEMYFRYWGDFMPLTSVFDTSNWNGFVAGSLPGMFGWRDTLMLLVPVVQAAALWQLRRFEPEQGSGTLWRRLALTGGCVCLFLLSAGASVMQNRGYLRSVGEEATMGDALRYKLSSASSLFDNWTKGFTVYAGQEIASVVSRRKRHELTDEERELVEHVLGAGAGEPLDEAVAGALAANRDKNLIFIIVESLNAEIVGAEYDGHPVTPMLDSLLRCEGTVAALNISAQIEGGGSSDGQLIYNTGLLPVLRGCTAQLYGASATFPSLAGALGKASSEEYIVEEGRIWFHNATSVAYGYDALNEAARLDSLGLDPDAIGGDRAVFSMALELMPRLRRPFFAEVVTLSMHFPYKDPGVPSREWIDRLEGVGETERDYIRMTSYFDSELGDFLRGLRREGLYDNSVIVIASDHDQQFREVDNIADSRNERPIVFMALNTGITARIDRPSLQMDVFPTVLDIMGCDTGNYLSISVDGRSGYRGLGQSLLRGNSDESPVRPASVEEYRRASDLIIRSDYFRPVP